MRFVAGRGAVTESHREDVAGRGAEAERMAGSAMAKRMAALWQRAIGKQAMKEPPRQAGKEHPALQANKKESGKAHSLKPALVMTALVRVTGARPRGSSQLLLCYLELLW